MSTSVRKRQKTTIEEGETETAIEREISKISKILLEGQGVTQLVKLKGLLDDALALAVAKGVVMYPSPLLKTQAAAVPITLLPTPFPSDAYQEVKELGPTFHELMDHVTCDMSWLSESLAKTGKLDVICGRLLDICKRVYCSPGGKDPSKEIRLHIMRNDFMLDLRSNSASEATSIKQIELNMIAASFAAHGKDLTEVHRYLLAKYIPEVSPVDATLLSEALAKALPRSHATEGIADAMAVAHKAYMDRWPTSIARSRVVLFVADVEEKNELDHRKLEAALFEGHGVVSIRRSLAELGSQLSTLLVPSSSTGDLSTFKQPKALVVDGHEVTVAYFRSGYWPGNYEPFEQCWAAREAIEESAAVKCPSAPAQLAGMKKIQELLCDPSLLKRFLKTDDRVAALLKTFGKQVDPSCNSSKAQETVAEALKCPEDWVLKPQVEGSGQLHFDEEIQEVLTSKSAEELAEFILMERIRPPATPSPVGITSSPADPVSVVVRQSVTEMGIFGTFVADGQKILRNEVIGHLLRSKGQNTNQGGVFVGNATVDVPFLVPPKLFWSSLLS
eukprot:TRINITY_DN6233_c0_g1_i1.p1 TRINITY_DN6233_c0_g1~~TRINITY_DN6233_c0_g1_i1.p1  ORF type:complete len:560 (-),score=118.96 TRINITY_DN6233_c0_g1_i1:291-1970(-)